MHDDKDQAWHMRTLTDVCVHDLGVLLATARQEVPLGEAEASPARSRGGARRRRPAAREYLRLIYGPEYTLPGKLERLRERGLSGKRDLALREFALGLEAVHRFVDNEPLRRVHECTFAVLTLESEPVDPSGSSDVGNVGR